MYINQYKEVCFDRNDVLKLVVGKPDIESFVKSFGTFHLDVDYYHNKICVYIDFDADADKPAIILYNDYTDEGKDITFYDYARHFSNASRQKKFNNIGGLSTCAYICTLATRELKDL